jgi:hypothetical protein
VRDIAERNLGSVAQIASVVLSDEDVADADASADGLRRCERVAAILPVKDLLERVMWALHGGSNGWCPDDGDAQAAVCGLTARVGPPPRGVSLDHDIGEFLRGAWETPCWRPALAPIVAHGLYAAPGLVMSRSSLKDWSHQIKDGIAVYKGRCGKLRKRAFDYAPHILNDQRRARDTIDLDDMTKLPHLICQRYGSSAFVDELAA